MEDQGPLEINESPFIIQILISGLKTCNMLGILKQDLSVDMDNEFLREVNILMFNTQRQLKNFWGEISIKFRWKKKSLSVRANCVLTVVWGPCGNTDWTGGVTGHQVTWAIFNKYDDVPYEGPVVRPMPLGDSTASLRSMLLWALYPQAPLVLRCSSLRLPMYDCCQATQWNTVETHCLLQLIR